MSRAAARRIADAMRGAADRSHERRGTGRHRGTVLRVDPLLIDLHGSDLELDADDVTIGRSVTAGGGIAKGDVLILVEVDEDDYVAVDVEEE